MQFRMRSSYGPRAAFAAPLIVELDPNRTYRRGECVGLFAQDAEPNTEIRAVVIELVERLIRVRALHDVHSPAAECVVRRGDEFVVAPANVFHVRFST